jgi:hypothetical protein
MYAATEAGVSDSSTVEDRGPVIHAISPTTIFAGNHCVIHAGKNSTIYLDGERFYDASENPAEIDTDPFASIPGSTTPLSNNCGTSSVTMTSTETPQNTPTKVNVHYRIKWADADGHTTVPRGLSQDDLKTIPPVVKLKQDWAPSAEVEVSPAKSAATDTSVRVTHTYKELKESVLAEVRAEHIKMRQEWKAEAMKYLPEREAFAAIMKRNFDDFVIQKFTTYLPKKKGVSRNETINKFIRGFRVEELSSNELTNFFDSDVRDEGNKIAHMKIHTKTAERAKNALLGFLEDHGKPGEKDLYERLWKFAMGEYAVIKK